MNDLHNKCANCQTKLKEKKMKKAMLIMAAMLVAGMTQAAAVAWTTGNNSIKTPNADGTFGSNAGANGTYYLATVYFFENNAGSPGAAINGLTGTTDSSTSALSALSGTTSDSFAVSTTYWAYVVVTTTDGMYSMTSSAVSFTTPGTGSGSVSFISALPTQWTVVPEPTSMALLALGVAAVGLRRRFRK